VGTFPGMISGSIANAYVRAAKEYLANTKGASRHHFAKIAAKNYRQGERNPNAAYRTSPPLSVEDVLAAPKLFDEAVTLAMVARPACGASAAVLVSEHLLASVKKATVPVEVVGQALCTDQAATFDASVPVASLANLCGWDGSRRAADEAYAQAGLSASDVDVAEIHDAFSSNEMAMFSALRLCEEGGAPAFVDGGVWRGSNLHFFTRGGRSVVVNSSGGLVAKGHPTGATGVAQCAELCWQLRGVAGGRQVPGAKTALQHNYGWSSAAVVTLYKRASVSKL